MQISDRQFTAIVLGENYLIFEYTNFYGGKFYKCYPPLFSSITLIKNNAGLWTINGDEVTEKSLAIGAVIDNL